jgi:hypothetical protein
MELLCDMAQLEARFGLFIGRANLDERSLHGLRQTYHRVRKLFWTHPMELLGDMGHVESHFSTFRDGVSVGAR